MKTVISLRAHHLGIIYEVVALVVGGLTVEQAINKHIERWIDGYYESGTISEVREILQLVFLGKRRHVFIEIVRGADRVCKAGCMQRREKTIKKFREKGNLEDFIVKLNKNLFDVCQNKQYSDDLRMLQICKLRTGKVCHLSQVIRILKKLHKEHKTVIWSDLIKCSSA